MDSFMQMVMMFRILLLLLYIVYRQGHGTHVCGIAAGSNYKSSSSKSNISFL